VSVKQVVVSSYSDLSKLSPEVKHVHFRKFISKKLLEEVLCKFKKVEKISISRYAFSRCSTKLIEIANNKLELEISERSVGRPNLIEKLYNLNKAKHCKVII
jgi:hypothetical protein